MESSEQKALMEAQHLGQLVGGVLTIGALMLVSVFLVTPSAPWLAVAYGVVLVAGGLLAARRDVPRVLVAITLGFGAVVTALGVWMLLA